MKFSGGAPGVFGSLIRFTLDEEKWTLELEQWEVWFFELRYYTYLHAYNHTYARIQQDLHQLNDEEWWLLKRLLGNDEDVTVMDKAAPRLLRMGVVTERPVETGQYGWKTILAIVSPMMKRVCLDARFQHEKSIKL
ncbi:hypothetical protein PF010_g5522 [Phytophthora fragariae]|nr:hypothetical protein PF003_g27684 [Phytophthora fragariae]KAE8943181.1 hypothetical protein PF009_g7076 [Phytophthora fragariae]KAE9020562.1 hypothetical protein PF011_g5353 [Phytophthora fragariae]KAE9125737.1 hypothetical protein PF010_g5522 [Phytophthora fragariae]KAE9133048.1 hypothetical protein PF007_g3500 [Phytophthora fragariae]